MVQRVSFHPLFARFYTFGAMKMKEIKIKIKCNGRSWVWVPHPQCPWYIFCTHFILEMKVGPKCKCLSFFRHRPILCWALRYLQLRRRQLAQYSCSKSVFIYIRANNPYGHWPLYRAQPFHHLRPGKLVPNNYDSPHFNGYSDSVLAKSKCLDVAWIVE